MQPFIVNRRADIAALCRRFHGRRPDVFGSATREGDFDKTRSDVDVLIDYLPEHGVPSLAAFLGLRDAIEGLSGRSVGLVVESAV